MGTSEEVYHHWLDSNLGSVCLGECTYEQADERAALWLYLRSKGMDTGFAIKICTDLTRPFSVV